jgi:hypothetical protein
VRGNIFPDGLERILAHKLSSWPSQINQTKTSGLMDHRGRLVPTEPRWVSSIENKKIDTEYIPKYRG